ncbi:MAG: hypothetical protein ACI90V_013093, partial [Bacillariaceae sp.]
IIDSANFDVLTRVVNRNNAKIGLFHSKQSVEPR